MSSFSENDQAITLKDVLKQLKALIARAEFIMTQDKMTHRGRIIVKMHNLLVAPTSHYFCPEAKLYISRQYISIADVVRAMEQRGERISRSGCEGRLLASAKKFVTDFGIDAALILTTDKDVPGMDARLDVIELLLLKIATGIDYNDNALDRLLAANGIKLSGIQGFSSIEEVTDEQIDRLIKIIEPYTEAGKAKRIKELNELSHVLWYFRKACIDSSDDAAVSRILRSII